MWRVRAGNLGGDWIWRMANVPIGVNMNYICVKWKHSRSDDPVWLYSEIDANRCETRKVEIYADGRYGFASAKESSAGTRLGEAPIPSLTEIAYDHQFEPAEFTKDKFEVVWQRCRSE